MTYPYNGREMDGHSLPSPSTRREMRQPGLPGNPRPQMHLGQPRTPLYRQEVTQEIEYEYNTPTRRFIPPHLHASHDPARPRVPPVLEGRKGRAITKPTQVPQWPLPKPPVSSPRDSDPYRPPGGRPKMPPQRPPRPSNIPSMVDQSRLQEPNPMFRNSPMGPDSIQQRERVYQAESPSYQSPREVISPVTTSPEAPAPQLLIPTSQLRKFPSSGPPPSSRRGQLSLYSTISLVSPIPEESLGHRVNGSYASSTAMPENLRVDSTNDVPSNQATQYEPSLTDESGDSIIDQYGDEKSLVFGSQDAAVHSVPVQSDDVRHNGPQPLPPPVNPFNGGSVFMDMSTDSSNTFLTNKYTLATSPGTASNFVPTPNTMLKPMGSLSPDPAELRKASGSPQPARRLSAMRRPPRLDMDAVRAAEARGSLTSLPDLILRATRLAAMIDKGKRPSSRLDDLDYFEEKGSIDGEKRIFMHERQPSGLSDMLAAFPPPVHTPQNDPHRGSSFWTGSWPVLPGTREREIIPDEVDTNTSPKKQHRRCCGLPVWAFVLVIILILCVIAVAVVLPLEFFVFKNLGQKRGSGMTFQDCQKSLTCLNGGTNVVFQNTCSCICTNGFTGASCNIGGSSGCTTTNLVATDGSSRINNVTLGRSIPRIIADSTSNFSIPLSGTTILAKLNSANLSCIAQNSLITFDGQSTRVGEANAPVQDNGDDSKVLVKSTDGFVSASVLTSAPTITAPAIARRSLQAPDGSGSTSTSSSPSPTATFSVTEEVLDFARTAVLYVLQVESVDAASTAQSQLQKFFSKVSMSQIQHGSQVTIQDASNLKIGGNSTINLVAASVDIGQGPVGGKKSLKRNVTPIFLGNRDSLVIFDGPDQPILPRGLKACR